MPRGLCKGGWGASAQTQPYWVPGSPGAQRHPDGGAERTGLTPSSAPAAPRPQARARQDLSSSPKLRQQEVVHEAAAGLGDAERCPSR